MSTCPRCGHEQAQWYTRLALLTQLGRGRPVDGYCGLADLHEEPESSGPRFNERQRKVLQFVLQGLSNEVIAARLKISESYVEALLQGLFKKTGVRTRGQLARVALQHYHEQL